MSGIWKEKDILITVKAYPEYSTKYIETVCTCGIVRDTGQMIRLYPIQFRYLEGKNKFSKYQWIKAKIRKSKKDARPESYNIKDDSIILGSIIGTNKVGWIERAKWLLNEKNIYNSIEDLLDARKDNDISLGIVKPASITGFKVNKKSVTEMKGAEIRKRSIMNQRSMLIQKQDLELLPFTFILEFKCENKACKGHKCSILDWEIAELYRKSKNKDNWKEILKNKILNEICGKERETYLLLGNMAQHQHIFCILGFFWPPKQRQLMLRFV